MTYQTHAVSQLQKDIAPATYADLDLSIEPERFRRTLGEKSILRNNKRIQALLADDEKVEFFRQLTLMGDPLADAAAALIPSMGFKQFRALLDQVLDEGVESVDDCPDELRALIAACEEEPEWLDWQQIEKGAQKSLFLFSIFGEAIIRAGFLLTFTNAYQGLPMVMTGALTGESAAKRMKETISTFKWASLPGALRPGGEAFKSAIKVRVMHAMVRGNLLRRKDKWAYEVYGVPIPQVDQMGAALQSSYVLAKKALKQQRSFKESELAVVNHARYLAFLLGMHQQFLSDEPKQIVETWQMCQATLKHQCDDKGRLLAKVTLETYRRANYSPLNRLLHFLDTRNSRVLFEFSVGKKTTRDMHIDVRGSDKVRSAFVMGSLALIGVVFYGVSKTPIIGRFVTTWAERQVRKQLANEGPAEYKTEVAQYQFDANKKS